MTKASKSPQHPLSSAPLGRSTDNLLNHSSREQRHRYPHQANTRKPNNTALAPEISASTSSNASHPYHRHTPLNFNNQTSPFLRKPIWLASSPTPHPGASDNNNEEGSNNNDHDQLHRHLSLFDLIMVGVGSTVGSGIFVLCGLIARNYAGPSTCLSWMISGAAACCSGLCYAELGALFPTAGSSYAYAYVTMGELPAMVAAACLTLEYVFSASAVARSWGDKIVEYYMQEYRTIDDDGTQQEQQERDWIVAILEPGGKDGYINPMAFIVSSLSVLLLLNGVKESKFVTNLFTSIKVSLILFLCLTGFILFQKENIQPFIPAKFGLTGVFRGATSSFFGYIGYDEICCLAGEAKNPSVNLPRSIVASLIIVTVLYVAAALALTGMVPFEYISPTSGFPNAFRYRGWEWCAQISALGEIITLPLVVLVTIMAQPRLQYAMSIDGLLPPIFSHVDASGNLWHGTLISGIIMVLIATCVPFTYLDDLISAGILVAFSMTDASVILLRHQSPEHTPYFLEYMLCLFNVLSFVQGLIIGNFVDTVFGILVSVLIGLVLISLVYGIAIYCPKSSVFGSRMAGGVKNGTCNEWGGGDFGAGRFQTPLVPYLPLAGAFANWYLIAQLEFLGLFLLVLYVGASIFYYFAYGAKHSVGNNRGWGVAIGDVGAGGIVEGREGGGYQTIHSATGDIDATDNDGESFDQHLRQPLRTMISLPRVRKGDEGYMGDTVSGSSNT